MEQDIEIEKFLNGYSEKKYVTKVETSYNNDYVEIIIQEPKTNNKSIEKVKYKPFLFIKDFNLQKYALYNSKEERNDAIKTHDIKIIPLTTKNSSGKVLERLSNGYCFLITTNKPNSYNNLLKFFKNGGYDINSMYLKLSDLTDNKSKKKDRIEYNLDKISKIKKDNNYDELLRLLDNNEITEKGVKKKKLVELQTIFDTKEKLENEIGKVDTKITPYLNKITDIENDILELEEDIKKHTNKKDLFFTLKIEEQFLIQSGIRIFKGFENYSEVHKMVFDIETNGLDAFNSRVFLIGIKDNMGFERILAVDKIDDNESEKELIRNFFKIVTTIQPSILFGYNSENFDFTFLLKRVEMLGLDLDGFKTTLKTDKTINKRKGTVKFGGESEYYEKTNIWGINVVDTYHAVRRAKAINSDIKEAGLKYISKMLKLAKPNRMYIKGGNIGKLWNENRVFLIDKTNNEYINIPDELQSCAIKDYKKDETNNTLSEEYINFYSSQKDKNILISGKEIVRQYLIDDLEETEGVDNVYGESSFLLTKLLSLGFERTFVSGGASTWNLLMTDWSFWKKLAIPSKVEKRDFTGGLSRTYSLGFNKKIQKADYAGLYPSIQLEHNVFPEHDVTNVLKRLLTYFRDTRNVYKNLANSEVDEKKKRFYNSKQLPIKILNNSNFGAFGSEYFNWADFDKAEEITCRGRQYLRLMVKYFIDRKCLPIVLDTDGIAVSMSDEYNEGDIKELFENLNSLVLNAKYMKVDDDGKWESCICLARKNYANLEYGGKLKLVGNSIKSADMSEYIEVFFDKGIKMLLNNQGKEFVNYYYEYLEEIFTKNIPLRQIASKAKVKRDINEYINRGVTKKGTQKPKQAHMELLIANNIKANLGDMIYYVNNGDGKSHGDVAINKKTGIINSYIILEKDLLLNPDMKGDYNVLKAIDSFNKSIEPLLVCFKPEIKNTLLKIQPEDREYYLEEDMGLKSYVYENYPFDKERIDSLYSDGENLALFKMEEKEVKFWNNTGLNPYSIFNEFINDVPLEFDRIFFDKLNMLQEKLKQNGSDKIVKTIKSKLEPDDILVIKKNNDYLVAIYDGENIIENKII